MANQTIGSKAMTSYLSFRIGEEMFAADVGKVREILELCPITKIPRAPDYMQGVINLRGKVLPVLDTRVQFGLTASENNLNTCIIVLDVNIEEKELQLGALVDSVEEVLELDAADIESPPSLGSHFNPDYMMGMVKKDQDFIMVLDVDKVFSLEEISHAHELSQRE